jgi:hypothetical protein
MAVMAGTKGRNVLENCGMVVLAFDIVKTLQEASPCGA